MTLCASITATAQVDGFGLRTNLLPWLSGSPGIGADISWNSRYLLAVDGNYGDWDINDDNRCIRHSSIGIELRRYLSNGTSMWANPHGDAYRGMYLGVDGRYHLLNSNLFRTGKEGNLVTAGLVVGYTFRLQGRWTIDAGIGCGYIHKDYNTYEWYAPAGMNRRTGSVNKGVLGLTNLSVALVYRFNR